MMTAIMNNVRMYAYAGPSPPCFFMLDRPQLPSVLGRSIMSIMSTLILQIIINKILTIICLGAHQNFLVQKTQDMLDMPDRPFAGTGFKPSNIKINQACARHEAGPKGLR